MTGVVGTTVLGATVGMGSAIPCYGLTRRIAALGREAGDIWAQKLHRMGFERQTYRDIIFNHLLAHVHRREIDMWLVNRRAVPPMAPSRRRIGSGKVMRTPEWGVSPRGEITSTCVPIY
tara:strand:+ start:97492 stop:97848 length:357 start_codon:yes stop_codon:yes gene_type:complete